MQKSCIIDIDGVLNYYPDCYVEFVNKMMSCEWGSFKSLTEIKETLSYTAYKNLKRMYRESGVKENLEERAGAREFLKELRSRGYYIIILSARLVNEINSLIMQTTNWLNKNNLVYDYLTFEKEKHLDIIQKFRNVDFVVDDNREIANNIGSQEKNVFLLSNKYNEGTTNGYVQRVSNFTQILNLI